MFISIYIYIYINKNIYMAAKRLHPVGIGSHSYSLLDFFLFQRCVGVPVPTPSFVPVQFGLVMFLPTPHQFYR